MLGCNYQVLQQTVFSKIMLKSIDFLAVSFACKSKTPNYDKQVHFEVQREK